jgi:hypothetical protein
MPMHVAVGEERIIQGARPGSRDAALTLRLDVPGLGDRILPVLPDTTRVAMIVGDSSRLDAKVDSRRVVRG